MTENMELFRKDLSTRFDFNIGVAFGLIDRKKTKNITFNK